MKKRLMLIGAVLAVLGLAVVARPKITPAYAEDTRIITVHVDGEMRTIATNAETVKLALDRLGVQLGEHDKAEPSLDTPINGSDFTINLYRARPIAVVDGPNNYTVLTAERSPAAIAHEAGFATHQEDQFAFKRSDDPFAGAPGTQMVIKRAQIITFDLYGTAAPLRTHATTVSELLEEKQITLEAADEVNLPLQSRITEGLLVKITKVGKEVKTVEEDVPFPEEKIQDVNQPTSYRQVKTPGQTGKKLVTYEFITHNGVPAGKNPLQEVITQQPVK